VKRGTSQATPFAAGVAALFLQQNPNASPQDVQQAMRNAASRDVVQDDKGSPNLFLQSVSIPPKGSERANRQIVKLFPTNVNSFSTQTILMYALIGAGVVGGLALLLLLYCCFCRKRSKSSIPSSRQDEEVNFSNVPNSSSAFYGNMYGQQPQMAEYDTYGGPMRATLRNSDYDITTPSNAYMNPADSYGQYNSRMY
jgi:hypothetical protein